MEGFALGVIIAFLMAVSSGVLLFVCFPPFNLSVLAWIAMVPLFLSVTDKRAVYGFFLSMVCGIVFFLGIFNWILKIPHYTFLHHTLLALYLGSYFGTFGFVIAFISRRRGVMPALFSAPFVWVALEYIRSNFFFLALPWGLLAHSQYNNPMVIQIASVTGAYGVSFLIVMVNAAIGALVLLLVHRLQKEKPTFEITVSIQGSAGVVVTAAILLGVTLLYGHLTVSRPITGDAIKLSVVQGNIDQSKKWDRQYADFIMDTYADLTRKAANDRPDLIVWPETATPGPINRVTDLYIEVNAIAEHANTSILLGSAFRKFLKQGTRGTKYFNSAYLISPEDKKVKTQRYDKIHLLPFGEYLPLKETIPWSFIGVPKTTHVIPGKSHTVFEAFPIKFGVTICWENIFPDLFRQFVKQGARFMINITNEAWFGKTAAPYQFVSMSVFRAVENRIFVVRCANTGVSCFIDPYGRIVSRVKDENGSDIFIRGVLTGSVISTESKTFYTQYGDWLIWVCLFFSIVFILFALLKVQRFKVQGFKG